MKYMVEIKLPKYKTNHFQSLVPDQQKQIVDWMTKGFIDVFTLNIDRTKVWFVMTADTKEELNERINEFVTKRFMLRIKIEPLMVYDSNAFKLPPLIMN
jgi:siroheme synthase (precorrin-2 oxidase/ferrochelatase)